MIKTSSRFALTFLNVTKHKWNFVTFITIPFTDPYFEHQWKYIKPARHGHVSAQHLKFTAFFPRKNKLLTKKHWIWHLRWVMVIQIFDHIWYRLFITLSWIEVHSTASWDVLSNSAWSPKGLLYFVDNCIIWSAYNAHWLCLVCVRGWCNLGRVLSVQPINSSSDIKARYVIITLLGVFVISEFLTPAY